MAGPAVDRGVAGVHQIHRAPEAQEVRGGAMAESASARGRADDGYAARRIEGQQHLTRIEPGSSGYRHIVLMVERIERMSPAGQAGWPRKPSTAAAWAGDVRRADWAFASPSSIS